MNRAIKKVAACSAAVIISGCSLRGDPVSLGRLSTEKLSDRSCVLQNLDEGSRELKFQPGSGKPYWVTFQIISAEATGCDSGSGRIAVNWKDPVIDEVPDMGKSKIRLIANVNAVIDGKDDSRVLCHTSEPLVAYSEWYPVRSLSLFQFRPPEDPHDPGAASMVAFERFLGEFIEFVTKDCL